MTIYTVLSPSGHCLGWHETKKKAWERAKKVELNKGASYNDETIVTKKYLKSLGYKLDPYTNDDPLSADEQMMLQGR